MRERRGLLVVAFALTGLSMRTAVTTQAYDSQGAVDISVAGKTWGLPVAQAPLTYGQFTVVLPSKNEALQLQRILTSSG